jgi:hypothetical protein
MADDDAKRIYHNLMLSLADEAMEMLDEELRAGGEPIPEGVSVKEILLDAAREHPAWKQHQLRKQREAQLAKLPAARRRVPRTAEGRRSLLERILALRPDLLNLVPAVQYREFKDLPDEDVASCLAQLLALAEAEGLDVGDGERDR